jgi:Domain of unknown function (DUF1929)/Glyoxal oxidase N-terminus/Kelch motif
MVKVTSLTRTRRRLALKFRLLALVLYIASATHATAQTDVVGRWSSVPDLPFYPVHAHLLPTGKVMIWPGDGGISGNDPRAWDPATATTSSLAKPGYDVFCSGHSFLADGRLLVTGGHIQNFIGLPNASIYDPFTNTWAQMPNMNAGRWYPTNTTLPNGDALVVSGSIDNTVTENLLPQVFQTASGTWRSLTNAQIGLDLYPRMHLAPNGRVINTAPSTTTRYLDTSGTGSWSVVGNHSVNVYRDYGSSVMYDDGKILVMGGGDPPTNTAEVIDLNAASPAWRSVASMAFARRQLNATVLPDGQVLVTGGTSGPGFNNATGAVFAAEMWNPATENWTTMAASAQIPRLYHSTALLLPDGRILSMGGNGFPQAEIYEPPYLFKGTRPVISSAPASVGYGQTFFVQTADAASISKVTWIRLSSVTHSFNMDQRFSRLNFSQASGGLNVVAPSNPNLSPPGYYLLFVLNGNGVPSVAKIVRIDSSVTAPSLTSLSPNSATAGGPAFTLTVNGSNFVSGSVVQWNGAARTTTFVSATQLTAAIPATDIATAGTAQVTVANPGGGTSNALTFTINTGTPAPSLTTLSPNSATAGGPAFTLTVNGSNFVSGSVVQWNGAARSTTFVNGTQLTAAIPASDIATAGTAQVRVVNPGGGTSNALTFTIVSPTFTLTVSKSGPGLGIVTSKPTGINCGSTCAAAYSPGTVVTLTVTLQNKNFVFLGWSGGGCSGTGQCTITMDASKMVTARFGRN